MYIRAFLVPTESNFFDPSVTIHQQRDEFRRMLHTVADNGHTLEDCHRYLTRPESKHDIFFSSRSPLCLTPTFLCLQGAVQLDPGFIRFRAWCDTQAIPFVILSRSAMTFPHPTTHNSHPTPPAVWPPSSAPSSPTWLVKKRCGIQRSSQTMRSCVRMDDGRSDIVIQRGRSGLVCSMPCLCFFVRPFSRFKNERKLMTVSFTQSVRTRQVVSHPTMAQTRETTVAHIFRRRCLGCVCSYFTSSCPPLSHLTVYLRSHVPDVPLNTHIQTCPPPDTPTCSLSSVSWAEVPATSLPTALKKRSHTS